VWIVSASHAETFDTSIARSTIVLGTVALIPHVLSQRDSIVKRCLRTRPLVAVGRVSYGIYLFHFPIFQWAAHEGWSVRTTDTVELAMTAAVVAFSWFVVERPALRLKDRLDARPGSVASPA
jgi:peptidoglycan/LPS O-acetylase OafA/YrhL